MKKTMRLDDGRGMIAKQIKNLASAVRDLRSDFVAVMEKQLANQYSNSASYVRSRRGKLVRLSAFAQRKPLETVAEWHARTGIK